MFRRPSLGRTSRFVLLSLACLAPFGPAVAAETFDIATFSVPEGWTADRTAGSDRMNLKSVEPTRYCVVGIYTSVPATADAAADFRAQWTAILASSTNGVAPPKSVPRRLSASVEALAGAAAVTYAGSPAYVRLLVMTAGDRRMPILFIASSRDALRVDYEKPLNEFLASIVLKASGAPPVAAANAAQPKRIALTDLVGEWAHSAASTTNYVSRSTGQYAGSSTAAYGVYYTLKPDLTFEYSFQGITDGRVIREKSTGTYGFDGDILFIKRNDTSTALRYRIIGWEQNPDGTTILRVLQEYYPLTEMNMGAYGEAYVRAPK